MRWWPWSRDPSEPDPRLVAAADEANRKLREVQARQPAVDRVRRKMADLDRFADSIESTFVRRHP